ncbi:MAG TPA: dipeptidase [Nocardioides sp.]|uniref:dipeptidase n=1 Tax=Nocardioides sp. TaxID=35761 RepID=UPI002D80E0E3|nr:dipeptidase [Nocardioides sp.]HET6651403.1 dipeptidase [Nocardioides sp.]
MKPDPATLRAHLQAVLPSVRADLEALVRIPSVSLLPEHAEDVRRSATAVADLFAREGFDVRLVAIHDAAPAVLASRPAPAGRPTVLLYAHHDVQPAGAEDDWDSPPFIPTERQGRLYGRGAADDKAGIAAHLAAIRAHGDQLPVGVTVFIEGEEESGSETLGQLLERHHDDLRADVIVIADSTNWAVGAPALTTSLRGVFDFYVEVRTLDHALHSGMWGGIAPDALMVLTRLLASLHDDRGNVAVDGLIRGPAPDVAYDETRLRRDGGILDGVDLIGDGSTVERLWTRPALTVIGLDAVRTAEASNTLAPSAKAMISVRLAPGDDPEQAFAAVREHLARQVPWGAQLTISPGYPPGRPVQIDPTGPAFDAARAAFSEAWDGTDLLFVGTGGSIPIVDDFARAFPDAALLVTGVEDPDTRAHSPNEGLHLAEWEKVCLAETLLLHYL